MFFARIVWAQYLFRIFLPTYLQTDPTSQLSQPEARSPLPQSIFALTLGVGRRAVLLVCVQGSGWTSKWVLSPPCS